jgi:hypothetical protein
MDCFPFGQLLQFVLRLCGARRFSFCLGRSEIGSREDVVISYTCWLV